MNYLKILFNSSHFQILFINIVYMKKAIFTLLLVAALGSWAKAQTIPSSADKRITLLTRVMATELQLNEAEYIKLRALNRERILKSDEVASMYSTDPAILSAKINEVEADFDKQFVTLLNPVQLAAYNTYKQNPDSDLTALQETKPDVKTAPDNKPVSKSKVKK